MKRRTCASILLLMVLVVLTACTDPVTEQINKNAETVSPWYDEYDKLNESAYSKDPVDPSIEWSGKDNWIVGESDTVNTGYEFWDAQTELTILDYSTKEGQQRYIVVENAIDGYLETDKTSKNYLTPEEKLQNVLDARGIETNYID